MPIILLILAVWLWPMSGTAHAEESDRPSLFATEWIQPSEASLDLIDIVFKGQVSALPEARQAVLDKALTQGDWPTMDTARQAAAAEFGAQVVLDWSATRHLAGYLSASVRYGLDLLSIGDATQNLDLLEHSVSIFLYIYGVTLVDGHKCDDPSSPKVFVNQIMGAYEPVRAMAATLPKEVLDGAIDLAVMVEKAIAPARVPDPTICSVGEKRLDTIVAQNEYRNALLKALNQRDKELGADGLARTELPSEKPPSWIKPEAEWAAEAEATREKLPVWLAEVTVRMAKP